MSDTKILLTIVIIFVFLGAILPFVNEAFNQDSTDLNVDKVEFETGQNTLNLGTFVSVVFSIGTMFFWTFGAIPALLEVLVFVPMRIIFVVLLFKLARGVGG